MLQAYPTKNGTGVSIFGDYGDLSSLYETVHQIAHTLNEENKFQKGQHQLLMNFAYEIRHAYSGDRLTDEFQYPGDDHKLYYSGFQLVWTDILIFITALRQNAGYFSTSKLHQANLYLLEYVIQKALLEYDPAGGEIITILEKDFSVGNEYAFIIYQALHIDFVSDRSGKVRFRKIPQLISHYFNTWSAEYKNLIASFQKSATEKGCEITDLEFSEFPEIKW
ncbi:hypothetical protein SAMN05428975_3978 [Mucilaginibacter sp. OK268]|uniref:DUF6904 family protein n=1 Tax=Mucilaginibacter sp. OK268 TaxID=1881048 RepID=UPI00088B2119|nr:hypothetical protein [Mucilaginibacter sp. OK268]SDP94708.1 hypothetical protein SAMN05428975_3978 [Mucilaginibacter sp. OK268]